MLIVSSGQLEKMSSAELVELFNSLNPERPVLYFSTHSLAVREVLTLLAEQQGGDLPRARAALAGRSISTPIFHGRGRRLQFNLPFSGKTKSHRKGTKRAKVIELLSKGCKFEVIRQALGWTNKQASDAIRDLHRYLGYGVSESDVGIIRLVKE